MEVIEFIKEKLIDENSNKRYQNQVDMFETAIRQGEISTIISLLKYGFDIPKYELNYGSTIKLLLRNYPSQIIELIKPIHPYKYIEYYYYTFRLLEKNEIDPFLLKKMDIIKERYLIILETLYLNGADINLSEKQIYDEDNLIKMMLNKKKSVKTHTPLNMAIYCANDVKSTDFIEWFLSKDDLILDDKNKHDENILSEVCLDRCEVSTEVLNLLLEHNIPLKTYTLTSIYSEEVPNNDNGIMYSLLEQCYFDEDNKTKFDKIKIIYQYATEEQRKNFIARCDNADLINELTCKKLKKH